MQVLYLQIAHTVLLKALCSGWSEQKERCVVMVEKMLVMVAVEAEIFHAATNLQQRWYKVLPDFAIIVILY